jgi:glycolate oxidase subunit GlcD
VAAPEHVVNQAQADQLKSRLSSPDSLITDLTARDEYHHDATHYARIPTALLLAESVPDLVIAVQFCSAEKIPITPRGAGTGLSGGCVVSPGGLLLSTENLTELEIVPELKLALCGPGVITKDLVDAAAPLGLTYPPDPASYEECTLGGNVAENAGGLRCRRFGVTKDYVLGLEAVLADGSTVQTGYFSQNRGFCLGELMIGSEGTLGIVTRMALRLIESPGRGETILVAFDDPKDCARTVSEVNRSGIIPTVMEFLDGDAAACSNEYEQTEDLDKVAALLLIETDDRHPREQAEQIRRICQKNRCSYLRSETDPERVESLWKVRRNLSNAIKALAALRISEDVAVPNSRFPELVEFVSGMNRESSLRSNSYGHAGDGNLHVNFMASADDSVSRTEVERCVQILMKKTIDMGGTLTGEHGIGLAKKEYLGFEFSPAELHVMTSINAIFDPSGLLNPDKLFPGKNN